MISTTDQDGLRVYPVRKVEADVPVTGKGDHPLWSNAYELTDFKFPWEDETPQSTKFKALHNADWLYGLFEVTDLQVHIFQKTNDKWEVASSSRAEIFFKIDDKLTPYYCLELDPLARVLDYRGRFYRKFDLKWSWPERHLVVKSGINAGGYTVEFAISKESLTKLELLKRNILQTGLYRADCKKNATGDTDFKWISWVKPDSVTPDFHIPSSFGILRLED